MGAVASFSAVVVGSANVAVATAFGQMVLLVLLVGAVAIGGHSESVGQ